MTKSRISNRPKNHLPQTWVNLDMYFCIVLCPQSFPHIFIFITMIFRYQSDPVGTAWRANACVGCASRSRYITVTFRPDGTRVDLGFVGRHVLQSLERPRRDVVGSVDATERHLVLIPSCASVGDGGTCDTTTEVRREVVGSSPTSRRKLLEVVCRSCASPQRANLCWQICMREL